MELCGEGTCGGGPAGHPAARKERAAGDPTVTRRGSSSEVDAVEVGKALLGGLERVECRVAEARVVLDDVVPDLALGGGEDLREVDDPLADDLDGAGERAGGHVLDVEQLDPVAVPLDHVDRV